MFPTRLLFFLVFRSKVHYWGPLARSPLSIGDLSSREEETTPPHIDYVSNSSAGNRRSRLSYRAKWDRISRGKLRRLEEGNLHVFLGKWNSTWIWNSLGIPTYCPFLGSVRNRRRSYGLEKGAIIFAACLKNHWLVFQPRILWAVRGRFQLDKNDRAFNSSKRLQGCKLIFLYFI